MAKNEELLKKISELINFLFTHREFTTQILIYSKEKEFKFRLDIVKYNYDLNKFENLELNSGKIHLDYPLESIKNINNFMKELKKGLKNE